MCSITNHGTFALLKGKIAYNSKALNHDKTSDFCVMKTSLEDTSYIMGSIQLNSSFSMTDSETQKVQVHLQGHIAM